MKILFSCVLLAILSLAYGNDECPRIIKRSQWATTPPGAINYLIVPVPYVIIQHTVTPKCTTQGACTQRVENIRAYHMDQFGWDDIGYSFLIGGDGNVYEGCGWSREGAHTYGYNKKSIGIAFIGNFQDYEASDAMIEAAQKLIRCGKSQGMLRPNVKVLAASQVSVTSSPGRHLFTQMQQWPEWSNTV